MTTAHTENSPGLGRSIGIASLIMMGSVLASRLLGVVRVSVLAGFNGTSAEMDAYVASFLIPEIVNHLLAGGFMSISFIPIFQKHLTAGDKERAWRTFSNLMTTGTLVLGAILGVCMVFTPQLLNLMGSHIADDPARLALTTRMTRIILPAQIFFYWGSLLMAVQYADKKFIMPAMAPLVYNIGIILGGVLLSGRMGVEGFAWGVLGGSIVGNFVLQLIGAWRGGARFRFVLDLRDPDLGRYVIVTLPLVIGIGMSFSNEVFFRYFGSYLGEGGLASLDYSLRTMMTLVAVFGQAFGVASFPFLSQLAAQGRTEEMNRLLFSMLGKVAVVMVPCSLLMMVLSTETVAVLFQRHRFTAASTLATSPVLAMYCIGAFGMAATTMLSRGFYALQKNVLPMVVSTLAAVAAIPLYLYVMPRMGAQGIALVGGVFMLLQFVALMIIWVQRNKAVAALNSFIADLAKITVVSAAGCLLSFAIAYQLGSWPGIMLAGVFARNLLILAASGVPALVLVMAVLYVMKVAAVREIAAIIRNKAGRG